MSLAECCKKLCSSCRRSRAAIASPSTLAPRGAARRPRSSEPGRCDDTLPSPVRMWKPDQKHVLLVGA